MSKVSNMQRIECLKSYLKAHIPNAFKERIDKSEDRVIDSGKTLKIHVPNGFKSKYYRGE